ncbi:anti-sigma factor antagonist [Streptomyces sp. NPDC004549]|uniref:anti-sigma factor antagonist n=1 Tax=unclassified Streptomyces TaxID=2593676 RepID=UPI0018F2828E|nr:anti-sigma factor antagonist [Streptomyces sp. DSM 110735]MBJ7902882.1 anti-sigma factor antagonist [Streptomyces sp. DSM 110735]
MRQDPTPPTRHLRVHEDRGHTVLELRGEIDIATAAEIAPLLDRLTGRPGVRLVLDLRPVEFFDCSGLRLVHRARGRLLERGGRLHVICTHPLTLRVFRVTGLTRLLPPHPTLESVINESNGDPEPR